jgi:lipopolysaccharide transport system ATP-binding protein
VNGDVVIRAEALGKKYVIGHESERERYTALRDVISRKANALLRATADMLRGRAVIAGDTTEEFWALRDVNFEIKRGEVVGVIGPNGAGKSTLLKVLSRITEPTEGRVTIEGRVTSLLEVGTGFHPELTGRENIYLNGAILGMSRAEIRRKFDEIVAFAEVERFLDTPVKRYSSGMYVRLAFAVAAHLEQEILVVDEVLAVGDGEFQEKCLGKMEEIATGGRAVLLVSHNMAAISNLTTRCLLLDRGSVRFNGATPSAISRYYNVTTAPGANLSQLKQGSYSKFTGFRFLDPNGDVTAVYISGDPINIEMKFEVYGRRSVSIDLFLIGNNEQVIAFYSTQQFDGATVPLVNGEQCLNLRLSGVFLAAGKYRFRVATGTLHEGYDHVVDFAASFEVLYCNPRGLTWNLRQSSEFGVLGLIRDDRSPILFKPASEIAQ